MLKQGLLLKLSAEQFWHVLNSYEVANLSNMHSLGVTAEAIFYFRNILDTRICTTRKKQTESILS